MEIQEIEQDEWVKKLADEKDKRELLKRTENTIEFNLTELEGNLEFYLTLLEENKEKLRDRGLETYYTTDMMSGVQGLLSVINNYKKICGDYHFEVPSGR